jgi:hypothetical protein
MPQTEQKLALKLEIAQFEATALEEEIVALRQQELPSQEAYSAKLYQLSQKKKEVQKLQEACNFASLGWIGAILHFLLQLWNLLWGLLPIMALIWLIWKFFHH